MILFFNKALGLKSNECKEVVWTNWAIFMKFYPVDVCLYKHTIYYNTFNLVRNRENNFDK